jgi:phosphotransferase family enzyme
MAGGPDEMSFYSFIGETHPLHPRVESLRRALHDSPRYHELAARSSEVGGEIHAEIKCVSSVGGAWDLDRFYWCFQYRPQGAALPFDAHTLYFRADHGAPELYDFPQDPYLGTMADWFRGLAQGGNHAQRVDVLRYVPLRRLTFRVSAPGAVPLIGKFKRRTKLRESAAGLDAVHRAARTARTRFRVAAPGPVDEASCVFYQEALPGVSLAGELAADNAMDLLRSVGELHAQMHALDVPGVPSRDAKEDSTQFEMDIRWIGFFRPDLAPELEALRERLSRDMPGKAPLAFLHGDFVPSQILVHPERWGITDFDLAHRGDPVREIAAFLASLKYDVSFFAAASERGSPGAQALFDRAEAAYLTGYEAAAGEPVDRTRLVRHRIAAEIHYLALMLKKDWYHTDKFFRAIDQTRRLAASLAAEH